MVFIVEISHLVVNGCSWSYGYGLDNPREQAWPALLARILGCELVNLAVPGCGNESITRRTYEYVYENKRFGNNPLFVIVFSQLWRKEVWMHNYYGSTTNDYVTMYPAHQRAGNPQEVAWLHEFNEEDFLRKNMLMKCSTKALLESLQYPHIICDFPDDGVNQEFIDKVNGRFPNWYNEYQSINDCGPINRLTANLDKTACQHPGPSAQIALADALYDVIKKKYERPIIQSSPFLKLSDYEFHKKENLAIQRESVWINH